MAKIWPLQSPVKHNKYSTSKTIAVPNTAYYHSMLTQASTAQLPKLKTFTPVEVQSVSHWQYYCSTVLNQTFPSHFSWGTVSLALAVLLQHSAQSNIPFSLQLRYSQSRTGSITAAQCSIKYSLLTPAVIQSVSHCQHYCSTVLNY